MWHRDDGSALMLMPAAVLVVIILAAIAVDSAVMFLGERELAAATAAAANDAAVAALDEAAFYSCGDLSIDTGKASRLASDAIARRSSDAVHVTSFDVSVASGAEPQVTVVARGTVQLIFAPALPGGQSSAVVEAASTARAQTGDLPAPATC